MTNPYQPPALPEQSNPPPYPVHQQSLGDNAGVRMLLPVGRSGWAIAAGYLGLFGLIIVPAPLALIVSIIAILDILSTAWGGLYLDLLWVLWER